ncbi:MAG: TIGR03905 family TSCPD domain-containing protein [Prevotella sp.]|nr:TIGR03905 family TSCPD domain-containing protein [Prevotella sp.]
MHINYQTKGTCSRFIDIEVDDNGLIKNVQFIGGCNGNLKGICSLIKGQKAKEVKERLKGIQCGEKATSCPDQLARALEQMGI